MIGVVEKVARAIHELRRERGYIEALWEAEPHQIKSLYLDMARAALSTAEACGYTPPVSAPQ